MLIKIEDVRKGDEILIPCNSSIRYLKVIRPPKPRKKNITKWKTHTSAWCSSKIEKKDEIIQWNNGTSYAVKRTIRHCAPPEEHNVERYENLNYKTIWLVKREHL